jgi:prepilin-type processing-associated H-X9-DG protein
MYVLIDTHEDSIYSPVFWHSNQNYWHSLPASRHNDSGVISFADGHVEVKKWLDPQSLKPVEGKRFYSPAYSWNRDAVWLTERSTGLP